MRSQHSGGTNQEDHLKFLASLVYNREFQVSHNSGVKRFLSLPQYNLTAQICRKELLLSIN